MICWAVLTKYRRVTDRQIRTDGHLATAYSPRFCRPSRSKNLIVFVSYWWSRLQRQRWYRGREQPRSIVDADSEGRHRWILIRVVDGLTASPASAASPRHARIALCHRSSSSSLRAIAVARVATADPCFFIVHRLAVATASFPAPLQCALLPDTNLRLSLG